MSFHQAVYECPWCHHTDPGHVVPLDPKWKNTDMNQQPRTSCQTAVIVQAGPKMKMAVPCGCTKSGTPLPPPDQVQQPLISCARPACDGFANPGQLFCSSECVALVMAAVSAVGPSSPYPAPVDVDALVRPVHEEPDLVDENGNLVNEVHKGKHAAPDDELATILQFPSGDV